MEYPDIIAQAESGAKQIVEAIYRYANHKKIIVSRDIFCLPIEIHEPQNGIVVEAGYSITIDKSLLVQIAIKEESKSIEVNLENGKCKKRNSKRPQ